MLEIKRLIVGSLQTNCYLIFCREQKETLILDPGDDSDYILSTIFRKDLKPKMIVATHGHFDHLMAAFAIQKILNIPFFIHRNDLVLLKKMVKSAWVFLRVRSDPAPSVNGFLKNGQKIKIGSEFLTVFHTPGHTPGGISLLAKKNKFIFVGDTVFAGGFTGRTDFQYSSRELLLKSLNRLTSKYKSYRFYPGHGKSFVNNKIIYPLEY